MLPKHHEDLAKQGRQLPLLAASQAWKTSGSGDPRLAVLIGEARLVLSNGQMYSFQKSKWGPVRTFGHSGNIRQHPATMGDIIMYIIYYIYIINHRKRAYIYIYVYYIYIYTYIIF